MGPLDLYANDMLHISVGTVVLILLSPLLVGEDATKRFKQETGIAFVPAPPGMLPMMPGMPMMPHGPHGGMPIHMMQSQFGMVPPLPPGVMPGNNKQTNITYFIFTFVYF